MVSLARLLSRWQLLVGILAALPGCSHEAVFIDPDADLATQRPGDMAGAQADMDLGATQEDGGNLPLDGAADARDMMTADALNVDALPSGVAQGPCHGCAWHRGRAACWGSNMFGQLGDDTRDSRSTAKQVLTLTNITSMAVGCGNPLYQGHTCAVTADDRVWCWGSNEDGQLGDQSNMDQLKPSLVHALSGVAGVSAGAAHTCAVLKDKRVFCWGNNQSLQLGDNTAFDNPVPQQTKNITDAVEVALGHYHSCARREAGSLVCWGPNSYGEIGNDSDFGAPIAAPVMGISDAQQLVSGGFHTCARRANGTAWCWGNGEYGTLGNGTKGPAVIKQKTPVQVSLSFAPVELAAGSASCARQSTGAVHCWGPGFDMNSNSVMRASPEPVPMLDNALTLGGWCATRPMADVSCWGFNTNGQIGDGTMTPRYSPQDVMGLPW